MAIPAYTDYTEHQLQSVYDEKFQAYIDSYLGLQALAQNPAQDAEDYDIANMPTFLYIEDAKSIASNSRAIDNTVSIQSDSLQAKFNDALDFCTTYFGVFYPLSGFEQMAFRTEGLTMDYDNATTLITVNAIL